MKIAPDGRRKTTIKMQQALDEVRKDVSELNKMAKLVDAFLGGVYRYRRRK